MKPHGLSLWQSLKRWKDGIFEPGLHKGNGGWRMWNSITSKRHIFYPFIFSPLFFSFLWNKASFTGRDKILRALCLESDIFTFGYTATPVIFVRSCDFGYPYFHCSLNVPYLTLVSPSGNYHTLYLCVKCGSEQTAIISLYSTKESFHYLDSMLTHWERGHLNCLNACYRVF